MLFLFTLIPYRLVVLHLGDVISMEALLTRNLSAWVNDIRLWLGIAVPKIFDWSWHFKETDSKESRISSRIIKCCRKSSLNAREFYVVFTDKRKGCCGVSRMLGIPSSLDPVRLGRSRSRDWNRWHTATRLRASSLRIWTIWRLGTNSLTCSIRVSCASWGVTFPPGRHLSKSVFVNLTLQQVPRDILLERTREFVERLCAVWFNERSTVSGNEVRLSLCRWRPNM